MSCIATRNNLRSRKNKEEPWSQDVYAAEGGKSTRKTPNAKKTTANSEERKEKKVGSSMHLTVTTTATTRAFFFVFGRRKIKGERK